MGSPHQHSKNDSLEDWPQRLLHVPTMTSYEWQEGHRYGAYIKPRYNAISYTWGRYELRTPDEQPHVKAIEIKGVSWAIPRIDETHFTVAQFEALIARSIENVRVTGYNPSFSHHAPAEFVWLDVACINQTPDHPQKAREIGRQAQIFKKAKKVLIWLNQSSREHIEKVSEQILQAAAIGGDDLTNITPGKQPWIRIAGSSSIGSLQTFGRWLAAQAARLKENRRHFFTPSSAMGSRPVPTGDDLWLESAVANIRSLTADRWFSSLWTLQEAFLCQWAYLISGEVEPLHNESPQLHNIFTSCKKLSDLCKASMARKESNGLSIVSAELELIGLVEENGLAALEAENPMALYTVASNRVTSRPEDHIYGIMQVFGFQLGISAPSAQSTAYVGLPELELQLGQQLIKQYPLMSQLHVHTRPAEFGQAWRVSKSSRVPELVSKVDIRISRTTMGLLTPLCELSSEEDAGKVWGSFSGKLCAFEKLEQAWRLADSRTGHRKTNRSVHQMVLDSTDMVSKGTFAVNSQEDLPRNDCQHRLAAEMARHFRQARLTVMVLLIGLSTDDQHSDEWWQFSEGPILDMTGDRFHIGLILVQQEHFQTRHWRRLGICIWDLGSPTLGHEGQGKNLLEGVSTEWSHHQGLFG